MNRSLSPIFIHICLLLLLAACTYKHDADMAITNARIITGTGEVLEQGTVIIKGNKILSVGNDSSPASADKQIDAKGKTVLPGLIDTHVHLLLENDDPPHPDGEKAINSFIEHTLPGRLESFLDSGVTTVMSNADFWPYIGSVRNRLSNGNLKGPRLVSLGPAFIAEGTSARVCDDDQGSNPWCSEHLFREVATAEEAREEVRILAQSGVDGIKMIDMLDEKLMKVISEEADRHDLSTYLHPGENEEAIEQIKITPLDHLVHIPEGRSDSMGQQIAQELKATNTSLATTISVTPVTFLQRANRDSARSENYLSKGCEDVSNLSKRIQQELSYLKHTLSPLVNSGLIAFGTDVPVLSPAISTECEIKHLSRFGLTPEQIIRAATVNAAKHIERYSEIGSLEPGKYADLIIVDGNPLEDIMALRNIEVVVKDGKIVVNKTN